MQQIFCLILVQGKEDNLISIQGSEITKKEVSEGYYSHGVEKHEAVDVSTQHGGSIK